MADGCSLRWLPLRRGGWSRVLISSLVAFYLCSSWGNFWEGSDITILLSVLGWVFSCSSPRKGGFLAIGLERTSSLSPLAGIRNSSIAFSRVSVGPAKFPGRPCCTLVGLQLTYPKRCDDYPARTAPEAGRKAWGRG